MNPVAPGTEAAGSPGVVRLWGAVWAVVFALWFGHVATAGLLRFPDDWDTLMYHLPLVDHWLQARSLYAPDGLRWSDPGNNELVTLWAVAPFSGDFLYALTNLPAAVLLACASVELGRLLGLTVSFRHLAGLAVVTNFVLLKQLIDTENDVAVAALFAAGLAYAMRHAERGRTADLVLGVACLGLLAGVKYYAVGYAAVAGAVGALVIARRRGGRAAARAAVAGLLGVAAFGGYWYARNWVAGGSPVYPMRLGGGSDELAGVYTGSVWATTFLGNGRPELPGLAGEAVRTMAGPAHLAALLALPVTIVWLVASGYRRIRQPNGRGEGAARLALALAAAGCGAVLLVTPFAVEDVPGTLNQMLWKYCPVRYGLCFLTLAVLALAALMNDVAAGVWWVAMRFGGCDARGRLTRAAGLVLGTVPLLILGAGVVGQVLSLREPRLHVSLTDAVLVGGNALLLAVNARWLLGALGRSRGVAVLALAAGVGTAIGIDWLSARWHRGFAVYYDKMLGRGLFRHMAEAVPPGTAVCVQDLRGYPFFGSARQFRVCQPPVLRTYRQWEDYLRANGVRLLVARYDVSHDYREWVPTRNWIAERPRAFTPVGETGKDWPYYVYEVHVEAPPASGAVTDAQQPP
jgi:hypothetical protein